jgi:hypothetical protein
MGTERMSIHIPELTVNPTSDVRAIGLGGALSFGAAKLGIGALWTRHQSLEAGQTIGTKLRDAAFLRLGDTYGRPRAYFSFAITGWPLFSAASK